MAFRFAIKSPLPPHDAAHALTEDFKDGRESRLPENLRGRGVTGTIGSVSGHEFMLRTRPARRRYSTIVVRGTIVAAPSGSIVRAAVGIRFPDAIYGVVPFVLFLAFARSKEAVWILAVAALFILALLALSHTRLNRDNPEADYLVQRLVMSVHGIEAPSND
jgi:hypothetical protein